MRLLLDTHIALWAIVDHPSLSPLARRLIQDPDNQVVVSVATVWEISIKHALARGGPNDMPISGQTALTYFRNAGYEMLDIIPAHAVAVETLPPLHGDPFDRMLVAQAMTVPLRLLTRDPRIISYSDSIIAV